MNVNIIYLIIIFLFHVKRIRSDYLCGMGQLGRIDQDLGQGPGQEQIRTGREQVRAWAGASWGLGRVAGWGVEPGAGVDQDALKKLASQQLSKDEAQQLQATSDGTRCDGKV